MVIMLRQCCCCCSLKTGTTIIGVLNILGGLGTVYDGISTALSGGGVDAQSKKELVAEGAGMAVLGAILLLVSICLIIGAHRGKPALLVPWMVYTIVFLIATTILYIIFALRDFAVKDAAAGAAYIIAVVIDILLGTYFLLVVYSLYRELKGTAPPNCA